MKIKIRLRKPKEVIKEYWWLLLTYIVIGGLLLLYKLFGYL